MTAIGQTVKAELHCGMNADSKSGNSLERRSVLSRSASELNHVVKKIRAIFVIAALFFCVNYSWTHAALAYAINSSQCPERLKNEAALAVEDLFGSTDSDPIMMCLNQPILGLNVSHGTTRFAPLLPSIIVLGPNGQTTDVASHEYAHAELSERTSVLLRSYKIPTWFDEGLAMQLDHREEYGEAALKEHLARRKTTAVTLSSLSKASAFFVQGDVGRTHYAFANCVVRDWLAGDSARLQMLIDSVSWFQEFPRSQFQQSEVSCLKL